MTAFILAFPNLLSDTFYVNEHNAVGRNGFNVCGVTKFFNIKIMLP